MPRTLLLTALFAVACTNSSDDFAELGTADEVQELVVQLTDGHEISFVGDSEGYRTIVETSRVGEVTLLDQYGSASAAAIFSAALPNVPVPSFLLPDAAAPAEVVAASTQALTEEKFRERGGCSVAKCTQYTGSDYVVVSETCKLDQAGGASASGTASSAYAQFNARGEGGVLLMKLPGGKVLTKVLEANGYLQARADGPRGNPKPVAFEIQGADGAAYDMYACFTSLDTAQPPTSSFDTPNF